MHEVSLMDTILSIVKEVAKDEKMEKVFIINIVVGNDLLVLPEALDFAFEMMKEGTLLEEATLNMREIRGREFYIQDIEGE